MRQFALDCASVRPAS